jgi:hypothetical protein
VSSTVARRLEQTVFYLDESIYSRILVRAMRAAGANVRHAGEAFAFGAQDQEWLTGAGSAGWIVLTRDKRIRFRPLEYTALQEAGVGVFAFTGGTVTARETAVTIVRRLRQFVNIATSEAKPFLYTFGLSGKPTRVRLKVRGGLRG